MGHKESNQTNKQNNQNDKTDKLYILLCQYTNKWVQL